MAGMIHASGLVKRFGPNTAVDHVDISVEEGEVYGFLGPNGAGKTTTIRMLTTLLPPTEGSISIAGMPLPQHLAEARSMIGIVQQQISLDKDISVRENIIYHAKLHKVPKKLIKERMERWCAVLGLTPFLDYLVINLSGGWKRKTAIACSLMHEPKLLFLDEPTAGLDAQSRHMLWEMVRKLNKAGTTIFITTHYIEEAEFLCDRVAIIDRGRLIALGSPQELCDEIGRVAVVYDAGDGGMAYRYFRDRAAAKAFCETIASNEPPTMRRTDLEDVFLELTGRKVASDFEKAVRV